LAPDVLCGGSPTVVVRVSDEIAAAVARLSKAERVGGDGAAARLLLDADMAEPDPPGLAPAVHEVAVVVPARDAGATIGVLLASIPRGVAEVVVVDDGSRDATGAIAAASGARVITHDRPRGPSAARNAGMAAVAPAPYVFVVDADASLEGDALARLRAHLADPAVGVVAPRILAADPGAGMLSRYEAARSPLDRGAVGGRVRVGARVGAVPSAAMLLRRDAVADVGGFDASLPAGEDTDLCWRLDAAGWAVRYVPDAVVRHAHRVRPSALARRRVLYGTPAVEIERRHPGAFAAVRATPGAVLAAAAAAVRPGAGAAIAAGSVIGEAAPLVEAGVPVAEAVELIGRDHIVMARTFLFAVTRPWLPLALLGKRSRRLLGVALLVRHLGEWRRLRPPIRPAAWLALRTVDDSLVALGMWQGMARARRMGPVTVRRRQPVQAGREGWNVLAQLA
jgi:mycofactocin system glycosyltransferase